MCLRHSNAYIPIYLQVTNNHEEITKSTTVLIVLPRNSQRKYHTFPTEK